jgi:hypothetical protein
MWPADRGKNADYRDGDYSLDQRETCPVRRHPAARLASVSIGTGARYHSKWGCYG